MKIAILGAGFAGLSTAWHLSQNKHHSITLFDPSAIGGQASSISAGLLHTYVGLHAKYNPHGREGYEATLRLLDISSKALNQPVYLRSGLLRPALSDSQQIDYKICAEKYDDVEWWTAEQVQKRVKGISSHPALWVKSAITVYPDLYLKGLSIACQNIGVHLAKKAVSTLADLNDFDAIIVATGPKTLLFPECASLKLHLIKGQILELAWPNNLDPLTMPINSQAYIVMNRDNKSCILGSTYERSFNSTEPDLTTAIQEILPKAAALIPVLANSTILSCRAGIRVSGPDHLPLIQKISPKVWVFTGLGSKGLLYHALYAKKLADQL